MCGISLNQDPQENYWILNIDVGYKTGIGIKSPKSKLRSFMSPKVEIKIRCTVVQQVRYI